MGGKRTSDKPATSHGTCVASVAFGRVGIMIQGTLVAVEVNENLITSDLFAAFWWAIGDIVTNKRQGRSVIIISLGTLIIQKMTFIHMY
jgi:hypothetical protein